MSSFKLHVPLKKPMACETKHYVVNPSIATLGPNEVWQCPEEYKPVKEDNKEDSCKRIKPSKECKDTSAKYHDAQKSYTYWFDSLHKAIKANPIPINQNNTPHNTYLLSAHLKVHKQHVTKLRAGAVSSSGDASDITLHDAETTLTYLFPLYVEMKVEMDNRQHYTDQCVCVGDTGHPYRTQLLREFLPVLQDECVLVLALLEKIYFSQVRWNVPIPASTLTINNWPIELSFMQELTLWKCYAKFYPQLLEHAKAKASQSLVFKQSSISTRLDLFLPLIESHLKTIFPSLLTRTMVVVAPSGTFEVDMKATLTPAVSGLPPDVVSFIQQSWDKQMFQTLSDKVLYNIETYGHPSPVTCLVIDPNTLKVGGVRFDIPQLYHYILKTHNIDVGQSLLKTWLTAYFDITKRSYSTCLDAVLRKNQAWAKQVCSNVDTMTTEPFVKMAITKVCSAFSFMNSVQTASTAFASKLTEKDLALLKVTKKEWKDTDHTNQRLRNGQPPTGKLLRDLPEIEISDLIELMERVVSRDSRRKRKREPSIEARR